MRSIQFRILPIALLLLHSCFASLTSAYTNPLYLKAISALKKAMVKRLEFPPEEEVRVSGFDAREGEVGHTVEYRLTVEIDGNVTGLRAAEDVERWEAVGQDSGRPEHRYDNGFPVLPPFEVAGPMELSTVDASNMRLCLPHDVDAGVLNKVILSDGVVVTVKGARSLSLQHHLHLPLPLTHTAFAAIPLLSLSIVGPTSLSSSSSRNHSLKLKLKRFAPGQALLEPSSSSPSSASSSTVGGEAPVRSLASLINGLEALLSSVLGPRANEKGSVRLLKADVSAQTFVKIGFQAEKKIKEGDPSLTDFPKWRTKPEVVRSYFEVLAKVDGDKVVTERIVPVNPVIVADTIAPSVVVGNLTWSRIPIIWPPPDFFTL